ncbi:MAG: hypothetical protein M1115_10285 [Actinobacteria bacterium]|nr:hypothetical protein [Actinomycetota bacterium]
MRSRIRRPELVLAAAVAISMPMLPGILSGSISTAAALLRFLIALLGCWAAGAMVVSVLERYMHAHEGDQDGRKVFESDQTSPNPLPQDAGREHLQQTSPNPLPQDAGREHLQVGEKPLGA